MYKFIQKNQKKFLAVFAVGLMVVFILPTMPYQGGGGRDVAFHIGDEAVSMSEGREARDQWQTLVDSIRDEPRLAPAILGEVGVIADEIQEHPELYLLLQREAASHGLRAPEDRVEQLSNLLTTIAGLRGGGVRDPNMLRESIRGLLVVRALLERVVSGIKPSHALVMRELATTGQRVKLDLVHYATEDFAKDVPTPTPDQLQKQFDKYKDKLAGGPTEQNPFGLGYKVPSQVKLLYLTVPRDEVAKAVRKRKSDFDRRVEALLHYRANPAQYPVAEPADTQAASQPATAPDTQPASQPATAPDTQPASQPATEPDTQPATEPDTQPASQPSTAPDTQPASQSSTAPDTRPTTRPFEEVEGEIIDELMKPEVDRLTDEIAAAVADRMKSDFDARQRKSAGAIKDFATLAYLERVKVDVQKKHGLEIGISDIDEPKSEQGLGDLKGIGQSFLGDESFPQFVMRWAAPFVSAADKGEDDVLSLGEPSRPFRDFAGDAYVFQIRQATPAHPPGDLKAVKDKVQADLRNQLAFDAALAAAKKLQAAAGADRLAAAARAAGKDVFTTPDIHNPQGTNAAMDTAPLLPGVELPPAERKELMETAFELLDKAAPDKAHPRDVVSLPAVGRVVVAELADVERLWDDEDPDRLRQEVGQGIAAEHAQRVLAEYFSESAVKQRLGYRNPNEAPTQTAAVD